MSLAHATLSDLLLNFIQQKYAGQPHAAKRLAQLTDSMPRAAENWLARVNAPSGERLAALLAAHPELEAQFVQHIAARRQLRAASGSAAAEARKRLVARQ